MAENTKWLDEKIIDVPNNKKLFKLLLFILGRRKKGITYKELYILYTHIYDLKNEIMSEIKEKAFGNILKIYYYNNNKYPF